VKELTGNLNWKAMENEKYIPKKEESVKKKCNLVPLNAVKTLQYSDYPQKK